MVETQPLSSGSLRYREEMWPLCSDMREKKEAGKIQTPVLSANFMALLPCARPGAQPSACFTSLSPHDQVCVRCDISPFYRQGN